MDKGTIDHSRDGESRYSQIAATITTGVVLSTTAVALRAFTRLKIVKNFGLDDAVMVFAQILVIGEAISIYLEVQFGLGKHTWAQPPSDLTPYLKSFYSSIILYNAALNFIKISILLQYRRIFSGQMMQKLTLYGIWYLGAWSITQFFLIAFVCNPVAAFWDPQVKGRCLSSLALWYVGAVSTLITDFVIFTMPLPVIRTLHLPRRQKMELFFVFGMGFFTCIISILRIRTLRVAAETTDPNWDNVDAATWSFLELITAALAACLPPLRRLFGLSPCSRQGGVAPDRGTSGLPNAKGPGSLITKTSGRSAERKLAMSMSDSVEEIWRHDVQMPLRSLQTHHAMGSSYNVNIVGGPAPPSHDIQTRRHDVDKGVPLRGGIKTTTVLSQHYENVNSGSGKV